MSVQEFDYPPQWKSTCKTPEEAIRAGIMCLNIKEPATAWIHFRRALDLVRAEPRDRTA